MIVALESWNFALTAGGGRFLHPNGPSFAVIELQLQARPLRRMSTLIAEMERELGPEAGDLVRTPTKWLHTDEGEYGAVASVSTTGPTPQSRHVGLVIGDDSCTCFIARSSEPRAGLDLSAIVEELVQMHQLDLGAERLRRYEYERLPGWRSVVRDTETRWFSPTYLEDLACLVVPCARPITESVPFYNRQRIHEEFGGELVDKQIVQRGTGGSRDGLAGVYTVTHGSIRQIRMSVLEGALYDLQFGYPFSFWVRVEHEHRHSATFNDFVRSVKPLPIPRAKAPALASE